MFLSESEIELCFFIQGKEKEYKTSAYYCNAGNVHDYKIYAKIIEKIANLVFVDDHMFAYIKMIFICLSYKYKLQCIKDVLYVQEVVAYIVTYYMKWIKTSWT